MSAWSVTNAHLDVIAHFITQVEPWDDLSVRVDTARARADFRYVRESMQYPADRLPLESPQVVGYLLRQENDRSVAYRYPYDRTMIGPAYKYRKPTVEITPQMVLAALSCWEYQACETPDFKESLAYRIAQAIESIATRRLTEGQPWGFDEEHVRPVPDEEEDDPQTEGEYYAELNRGYAQDR